MDIESEKFVDMYNKLSNRYDIINWFIPSRWRRLAVSFSYGRVLEIGVGTGLNFPYYCKPCTEILGIDISTGMLEKAKERISLCSVPIRLECMNVQDLDLESTSIDSVLATFVFCTVPNSLQGLRECHRILKPGGKLILLEHMRSDNKLLCSLMNLVNPFALKLINDNINRNTVKAVVDSGFTIERMNNLLGDVVRLIVARK